MPWHLQSEHPSCPASKPWAVVKDSDGSVAGCHASKADAQAQMGALYAKEPQMSGITTESGGAGLVPEQYLSQDVERRTVSIADWEVRHSGRADEAFTIRGYPIVYGQRSLDLGGFTEIIEPGAADEVLASNPDVKFNWEHDNRWVGAATSSGTLSLRSDSIGVYADAQIGNYTWAKDLRTALERGDISQGSFAFHVAEGGDRWEVDEETNKVTRTITNISELYDVTVAAQGAYPQTSLAAQRSLAAATGRQPKAGAASVAPDEEGGPESHEGSDVASVDVEELRAQSELRRVQLAKMRERMANLL